MKLFLSLVMTLTTLIGQDLTDYQRQCLTKAIAIAKPYQLGNTIAGIIWVESKCVYKVNPVTGDYGITQVNIKSLLNRLELPTTTLNKSFYATQLVTEDAYAVKAALAELLYWQLDRKRTGWYHLVGSYNQGNVIESNNYASKVANAIRYLKQQGVL